jgi:hypothetical protein
LKPQDLVAVRAVDLEPKDTVVVRAGSTPKQSFADATCNEVLGLAAPALQLV